MLMLYVDSVDRQGGVVASPSLSSCDSECFKPAFTDDDRRLSAHSLRLAPHNHLHRRHILVAAAAAVAVAVDQALIAAYRH
jgi:hypothetical protein